MSDKFEQHCIVELMGHQRIAGYVTEQVIGGAALIRVDVPRTPSAEPFTKFYGASAIYGISPVSAEIAQGVAETLKIRPINEWDLPAKMKEQILAGRKLLEAKPVESEEVEDDIGGPCQICGGTGDGPAGTICQSCGGLGKEQ